MNDVGDNPELRRRIENNDPSLDKLAIWDLKTSEYEQQTYVPSSVDAWKADGISLGRNTHIKKIKIEVPEDVEKDTFRIFCEGLANNSSIEYMYIAYSKFGADVFYLLKPFFLKNKNLREMRLDGNFGSSNDAVEKLCEALQSFCALRKFRFHFGTKLNETGTELLFELSLVIPIWQA